MNFMEKKRILFVCHGNICRSPMAEFVLKDMAKKGGLRNLEIDSRATSSEELGNPPHSGTVRVLKKYGIPIGEHRATRLCQSDYDDWDFIIGMDSANIRNILRIFSLTTSPKVRRLLDFTDRPRDIADPWYTRMFDDCYQDILAGCQGLLDRLGY